MRPRGRAGGVRAARYTTRGHGDQYKAIDVNGLRRIFLHIPPPADGDAGEITVRGIAVGEYHGRTHLSSGPPGSDGHKWASRRWRPGHAQR